MTWKDSTFTDLYELLDVWPDADENSLRHRISELYLEARDNIEHQSHRKRFYYRELFEVLLPQARLILLDAQKRKEYDHELQEYWKYKGKPVTPKRPKDTSRPKLANLPGTEEEKAADDFSDFGDISEDKLPPLQMPHLKMDKETVERRRDAKRRELIKHELVATGQRWAALGGIGAFVVCAALALMVRAALSTNSIIFHAIAALILLAAAILTGRQTMRWAKRRTVGVLSQMPYDELLRHCGGA